jgi:hypothetical protein
MTATLSEHEVLAFLRDIETGIITLAPTVEPQHVYAGNVEYTASNGWRIVVFNDANEWDYIDEIITADGRRMDFDHLEALPGLREYTPSKEVAWERYGIPGYRTFRCRVCGQRLKGRQVAVYRCGDCLPHSNETL